MKYTHDVEGLLFEKLQVSGVQTHYACADSEELKRKVLHALRSGDYYGVQFILVRTAELMELEDGEIYGRYCPLEVVLERTPYYAVEAKQEVLQWLSEKPQETISQLTKPSLLRRLAAWLTALADRLETP